MNEQWTLYIDQYGNRLWARTIKELRDLCGGGRVFKIYVDKTDGKTVHCGYGVGHRWFTAFSPVEKEA